MLVHGSLAINAFSMVAAVSYVALAEIPNAESSQQDKSPSQCNFRRDKFEPKSVSRTVDNITLDFAIQFRLKEGLYQQLQLGELNFEYLPDKTNLHLSFDCGKMSIEFIEDPAFEMLNSRSILAKGELVDGKQFQCLVPESNGAFQIYKHIGLTVKGTTMHCKDNVTWPVNQIVIDWFRSETHNEI